MNYGDFGRNIDFGDFNDDGCADLAVGAAGEALASSVYIFYGSKSGLKTDGSRRFANAEVFGGQPEFDGFGCSPGGGGPE